MAGAEVQQNRRHAALARGAAQVRRMVRLITESPWAALTDHSSPYCPFAARPPNLATVFITGHVTPQKAARSMRGQVLRTLAGGAVVMAFALKPGNRASARVAHDYIHFVACGRGAAWNLSVPPGSRVYTPSRWRRSSGSADHRSREARGLSHTGRSEEWVLNRKTIRVTRTSSDQRQSVDIAIDIGHAIDLATWSDTLSRDVLFRFHWSINLKGTRMRFKGTRMEFKGTRMEFIDPRMTFKAARLKRATGPSTTAAVD